MIHTQTHPHHRAIAIALAASFIFIIFALAAGSGSNYTGSMSAYLSPDEVDFVDIPDYLSPEDVDIAGNPTISSIYQDEKTYPAENVYLCNDPIKSLDKDVLYDDSFHGSAEKWYEFRPAPVIEVKELTPGQELELEAMRLQMFEEIVDRTQDEIYSLEAALTEVDTMELLELETQDVGLDAVHASASEVELGALRRILDEIARWFGIVQA